MEHFPDQQENQALYRQKPRHIEVDPLHSID